MKHFLLDDSEKERYLESPEVYVHNALSSRVEPAAKRIKKIREQASSSTPVLIATEASRPQAADLVHKSAPLDECDAGEVGKGASQASKNMCSGCLILRNEKRKLNTTVKSLREKLREKRSELAQAENFRCPGRV